MATTIALSASSIPTTLKRSHVDNTDIFEFEEGHEYLIAWVASNADTIVHNTLISDIKFRRIVDYLLLFTEIKKCEDFIRQVKNEKIFIITEASSATPEVIARIHDYRQVYFVFVYKQNINNAYTLDEMVLRRHKKLKGIYENMEKIILDLSRHLHMFNHHTNPELLYVFKPTSEERTVQNRLNTEWFHYFLQVVIHLKPISTSKQTFVSQCTAFYKNNTTVSQQIKEFEEWYEPENAIFWYTRDNFLYRLLNKAFRQKNRDLIWLMHFFIVDLYEKLRSDCLIQSQQGWTTEVYRGQLMTKQELNSLKLSLHSILSANSFFSTTVQRGLALIFSGAGASEHLLDDDLQPVLFQISCNGCNFEQQTFANIKDRSANEDEEEVMFVPGTMFLFQKLFYNDNEKVWVANLKIDTLLVDLNLDLDRRILKLETLLEQKFIQADNDAKKIKLSVDNQIPMSDTMKSDFESLLHELSLFDQYMVLCKMNSEVTDDDTKFKLKTLKALRDQTMVPDVLSNEMQICIYDCLGIINIGNIQLTRALNYFSLAENIDSDKISALARKVNVASIHKMNGNYVKAWQLCKEVLDNIDISSSEDNVFGSVGVASCGDETKTISVDTLCEYEKFTDFVAISDIDNYENHVRSAYLDIGDHYEEIGQLNLAIKCYQKAIQIVVDDLDSNADCYKKCSEAFEKQNDFDQAIEYRQKMHIEYSQEEDVYESTCKDVAISYGRLGTLYVKQNKLIDALKSFHRSFNNWSKHINWKRLEIENESLTAHQEDPIYVDLANTYEELANVIINNDDFATFCFQRAIEFRLLNLHIELRMNRKEINCDPKISKYYDAITTIDQRRELDGKNKSCLNKNKT
ncbi:unnamed protein product [Rotaria socialis]|uniref:Uncharacterized protein n=1 Tax=Rotaria socialis TaxID=392032 RepID=A0A817SEF1_9BILA|nr:unnamed protein product [Rotaria socialis]CAF4428530.1 unnamed protein product [Rotaria socialis]